MAFSPIQLTPNMDTATLVSALNDMMRQLESENRTKIITDEEGVQRVIIGRKPDGSYVLQVSKSGVNVSEAGPDDLILNSHNNLFKIVDSGEVSMSMPSVANGTSSPYVFGYAEHDLDYAPMVIAFMTIPNAGGPGYTTRQFGSGVVQAKSVNTTAITIGYLSEERIESTAPVGPSKGTVSFAWRTLNSNGPTMPPINANIKYYLLTESAG